MAWSSFDRITIRYNIMFLHCEPYNVSCSIYTLHYFITVPVALVFLVIALFFYCY